MQPWMTATQSGVAASQPAGYASAPAQPDYGYPSAPSQPGHGYGQTAGQPPSYGQAPIQPGYSQPPSYSQPPAYGQPPSYGQQSGQHGHSQPPSYGQQSSQPGYGYTTPASQAYYSYPQTSQPTGYTNQPIRPGTRHPALAGPGSRLGARIIDWLILGVLTAPLWAPVWASAINQFRAIADQYPAGANLQQIPAAKNAMVTVEGRFIGHMVLVVIAYCVIALAYDWIQHGLWGQTLGKRAVGIVVVSGVDGSRISTGAAGGRAAVYALPGLVPFVGGLFALLNELWLLWDSRRQCLHDKAAHTVVIKKSYLGIPAGPVAGW